MEVIFALQGAKYLMNRIDNGRMVFDNGFNGCCGNIMGAGGILLGAVVNQFDVCGVIFC